MTTRTGNYQIYKMYNRELNDYTTVFFLPDDSVRRMAERLLTLASLREKGYRVAGILYVDRESYLNAKLSHTVEEYLGQDNTEREVKTKYHKGEIDREVYLDTIRLTQDYKWTCLKKIDIQIRRMMREDIEIYNEIALQLYDQYLKVVF